MFIDFWDGLRATVEAGNAITSWLGKGEIYEIGKDRVIFHGALDDVIFIHLRKGGINAPRQAAKMHCLVTMNVDKNTKERASEGFCMITPNEESGMVYTEFQCAVPRTNVRGSGPILEAQGSTLEYPVRQNFARGWISAQRKRARSAVRGLAKPDL